jgi:hypothetical protein
LFDNEGHVSFPCLLSFGENHQVRCDESDTRVDMIVVVVVVTGTMLTIEFHTLLYLEIKHVF